MKKNMKKAAALTLSAVMTAGLLTGCGASDSGASGSAAGGSQTQNRLPAERQRLICRSMWI